MNSPPTERRRALRNRLSWVAVYAVAMAAVESAVVAYLRTAFYPGGMAVALKALPTPLLEIEVGREAATLVMLLAVAMLAGTNRRDRFAYFMIAFGIWDIFYYIWLALFIGWPASLLDWDILFLIPVPWTGPVLAPVLISLALVFTAVLTLRSDARQMPLALPVVFWISETALALLILLSFMLDYRDVLLQQFPERYRWEIFLPAYALGLGLFLWRYTRPQDGTDSARKPPAYT